jgi:hypothetical protein
MEEIERVWHRDFNNVTKSIPESWILTLDDGSQFIRPEHTQEPRVQLLQKLATVGYARGWMP